MALPSPFFVPVFPLQEYFVDKVTGAPLSGGVVTFYHDTDRTVKKNVYQQVQLIDNTYDFQLLNNPIILTSVGTFADNNGNDIIPYLFPYTGTPDNPGALDLYFITVYAAQPPVGDGTLQFTREAWPPGITFDNEPISIFTDTENLIANPQFAQVNFNAPTTVFAVTGTNTVTNIAPDWDLITSGSGNLTVTQMAIVESPLEGNPPYILKVNSTGLTGFTQLRQRFTSSPRLLLNDYINGSLLAAAQLGIQAAITMTYVPSQMGAEQFTIIDGQLTDNSGTLTTLSATISTHTMNPSTATAPSGYVDILISFPVNVEISISNVQLIGVENPNSSAQFISNNFVLRLNL